MRRLLTIYLAVTSAIGSIACTSAVISGRLTESGRPILWKNRDTSHLTNYVRSIAATDSTMTYVALFNSSDTLAREAWIGYNSAGFAIMNTASYNLHPNSDNWKDREGFIMSEALATCTTVDDFRQLISEAPKPLGVEANFGVIDAFGNGGYFETDDSTFTYYPADDEHPLLIRTNFSVSGGEGGLGHARYDNAEHLLSQSADACNITPYILTDSLSRSFYHSPDGKDKSGCRIVTDNDFIPRYSTSASVAIEGATSAGDTGKIVMWTLMGYPPCGVTEAVTIDNVPSDLLPDGDKGCKASRKANAMKSKYFFKRKGNNKWQIKLSELQQISAKNKIKSLNNYKKR